jgi:hypothetical protein
MRRLKFELRLPILAWLTTLPEPDSYFTPALKTTVKLSSQRAYFGSSLRMRIRESRIARKPESQIA